MRKKINGKIYNIRPGADLSNANLHGADLSNADLHGADLNGANLYGASLAGASLAGADLNGANLHGADLAGAELYGANLSNADLSAANLHGANLAAARLHGANLAAANLHGANLNDARLRSANLNGAEGYRNLHAVFQELCSRCDNDFFTIAEWGQIAMIVIKKWCWPAIIAGQPALASSVFWKLHGKGWIEFYEEYIKKGGVRHENDDVERYITIV